MEALVLAATLLMQPCAAAEAPPEARLAVAGCCKIREGQRWISNGMGFEECLEVNAVEDGDDLYEALGLYWWDTRC